MQKLDDPKYVCLMGNHDFGYFYPHIQHCPGYTAQKEDAIRSVMKICDFKKLKTHYWAEGHLISHAGYSDKFIDPYLGFNEEVTRKIDERTWLSLDAGALPPFCFWGQDRNGVNPFSGPLWAHWWTFKGIPGVKQIVGHTNMTSPNHDKYGNICLDTQLGYVGLLDAGKLQTLSTKNLC